MFFLFSNILICYSYIPIFWYDFLILQVSDRLFLFSFTLLCCYDIQIFFLKLKHSDILIIKYSDILIIKYSDIFIIKYSDILIIKYSDILIIKYSDMLFLFSNILIFSSYILEILSRTTCCWMPGVMSNCQILGFALGWRNLTGLTSIVIFPKSSHQISPPTPWTPRGRLRAGRGTGEPWRTPQ